jgi:hypothetical protein
MSETYGWISFPALSVDRDGEIVTDRNQTLEILSQLKFFIQDRFSFCASHNENDLHGLFFASFHKRGDVDEPILDQILEFTSARLSFFHYSVTHTNSETGQTKRFEKIIES